MMRRSEMQRNFLDLKIKELSGNNTEKIEIPTEFWCGKYDNPDGSTCCFNHWVGLPERWG